MEIGKLALAVVLTAGLFAPTLQKKEPAHYIGDLNRDNRVDIYLTQGLYGVGYPQALIQKEDGSFELTNIISDCGYPFFVGAETTYSYNQLVFSNRHIGGGREMTGAPDQSFTLPR